MKHGKDEAANDGFRNGQKGRQGARREDDADRAVGADAEAGQAALAAGEGEEEGWER